MTKEDAIAAVYVDIARKSRRESNIIVCGLQQSSTETDIQLVHNLRSAELGTQPDIVHAKRLGRIVTGKTQPLLVAIRDAEEAKNMIRNARDLRHSTNSEVENNVYTNPNLTAVDGELTAGGHPSRLQVNNGTSTSKSVNQLNASAL
jgi:hypothetical protein